MVKNFNTNTDNHDEWLTPPEIIKSLGEFDLDPCAPTPETRPWETAKNHFCIRDNGLDKEWAGRVWMNPPYGRETFAWMQKLAGHGNGIALIFARTDTKGFHREVFKKADAILFLEGRIKFCRIDGKPALPANAPSCLIAYGKENVESLKKCGIKGRVVILKEIEK